jgi:hypothetical protein
MAGDRWPPGQDDAGQVLQREGAAQVVQPRRPYPR